MKRLPRLPDVMLCLVFIQTPIGVIVARVIADFIHRPFPRKRGPVYWTSWRPLTPAEVGWLLGRRMTMNF